MKRDFLKDLGIEDKALIDKILDENSKDIGRAKGDIEDLENQITRLQKDLEKKTSELDSLKESTKDYSELSERITKLDADNAQLIADKKQLEVDLDLKVSQILKNHAIENGVRDAKAKNVKAVMALLDVEKITYTDGKLDGLQTQLDTLMSDENSSFMFGETKPILSGTTPSNPLSHNGGTPPTSKTLSEAILNSLKN